ncbi:MAG: hypothetical protein D3X82_16765 [Candidatus Leucobacter sulfamidivorax]|nr:hypothetical protein [Candidatus Leucobacter sulfamidivorax]
MTTQQVDAIDTRRGTIELIMIRPSEAVIDTNVREHPDPDPELVNSIAERGVLQPPTCWVDEDGIAHVTIGQRRTLAAVLAGDDLMPAIAKPRAEAEAERIYEQLTENDRRAPLPFADRLAAYEQLTLFGIKADEIAKQTGTRRDDVRNAVRIVKDAPKTVEAARSLQLTLDGALVLAEFEDDEPEREQLAKIIETVAPQDVERSVAELRFARDRRLELERLQAEAAEQGIPWVDPGEIGRWNSPFDSLRSVRIGKAEVAPTVAEAQEHGGLVASAVEERDWKDGVRISIFTLGYWVKDAKDHGYRIPRNPVAAPVSDAEKEQRRKDRAEKKARTEAWGLATEVRQTWIRDTLLTQKSAPDGAQLWILKALLAHKEAVGSDPSSGTAMKVRELALAWFGIDGESEDYWAARRPDFMKLATARPGHSETLVALAFVLACSEISLSDPKSYDYGRDRRCGAYLRQLEQWGHSLSKIEAGLVRTWEKANPAPAEESTDG